MRFRRYKVFGPVCRYQRCPANTTLSPAWSGVGSPGSGMRQIPWRRAVLPSSPSVIGISTPIEEMTSRLAVLAPDGFGVADGRGCGDGFGDGVNDNFAATVGV